MAVKFSAFAFMLVFTSSVSFMVETQMLPQDPLAPIYFSDSPMMSPLYNSDSPMMSPSPVYDSETPEYFPSDNSPIMAPTYFSDNSPVMTPEYFHSDNSPIMAPIYFSDNSPVMTPVYLPAPPPPRPHIPKHCAVGCVEYCRLKPKNTSKRTCQRICSLCCQKCNCIPMHEKPMSCGNWDKIMYHGVQVTCP